MVRGNGDSAWGQGLGREANRKELFGKILKAQTDLKVEVWNMGKKMKETQVCEELKTLWKKPSCDFEHPVWEIATKGNGKLKGFHLNAENSPSVSLSCVAVSRRA